MTAESLALNLPPRSREAAAIAVARTALARIMTGHHDRDARRMAANALASMAELLRDGDDGR